MSHKLGYGDINKRDMKILIECLDMDKDGKISINDFKDMLNYV